MTVRGLRSTYAAGLTTMLALAGSSGLAGCSGQATADAPPATRTGLPTATSPASPRGTGSPRPTTSRPAPSATPRSTPSVDPVLARIPPEARPETADGSAAYVKFYMGEINRAFRSADPAILEGLASPDCKTCNAFQQGVRGVRSDGQHYGGDLVKVVYSTAMEFSPSQRQVLVSIEQREIPVLDKSGTKVSATPPGKASLVATMKFAHRWHIIRLQEAQ